MVTIIIAVLFLCNYHDINISQPWSESLSSLELRSKSSYCCYITITSILFVLFCFVAFFVCLFVCFCFLSVFVFRHVPED